MRNIKRIIIVLECGWRTYFEIKAENESKVSIIAGITRIKSFIDNGLLDIIISTGNVMSNERMLLGL